MKSSSSVNLSALRVARAAPQQFGGDRRQTGLSGRIGFRAAAHHHLDC